MKNDYLWDKTGEDPEIERLEKALSEFRLQELALPPALPAKVLPFKKENPRKIFSFRIAAAAAACLTFGMLALGVWLQILRNNIEVDKDVAEIHVARRPETTTSSAVPDPQVDQAAAAGPITKADSAVRSEERSKPAAPRKIVRTRRTVPATVSVPRKEMQAQNIRIQNNRPLPSGPEEVRLTKEERYAYEQLMMALSFTSSKLKLVKDKVEGMED
jgi:hypothetical protein